MPYLANLTTKKSLVTVALVLTTLVLSDLLFAGVAVRAEEESAPTEEILPAAETLPVEESLPIVESSEESANSNPLELPDAQSDNLTVIENPDTPVIEEVAPIELPSAEEVLVIPASEPAAATESIFAPLGSQPTVPVCVPNIEAVYALPDNNQSINLNMESEELVGPRILAYWSMAADKNENNLYLGSDDDPAAGAQFLPSGQFEINKNIAVCAVVINGSGLDNLATVTAAINYPVNIALPTADSCGNSPREQLTLGALSSGQTEALLCQELKNNNNNLPIFGHGVNFDTLCAPGGKFAAGTAAVYCGETKLAYGDPAGDYQLKISALDNENRESPVLISDFKYLELTAYAVDFDNVSYGRVQPHTPKIIAGDLEWQTPFGPNPATVRNVGNTRIRLIVRQNDFGLGKTWDNWNVAYSARVGAASEFVAYAPDEATTLASVMELAETNSLDFGIEVFEFPSVMGNYAGQMTLTADKVEYLTCSQ